MATHSLPIQFTSKPLTGITVFQYGVLGGGGYADNLALSLDGAVLSVRQNLANIPQWQRASDQVFNISVSPNMDALSISSQAMGTPYATAYGTGGRMYAIFPLMPGRVGIQPRGATWEQFYASNDNGATWYKPGPGGTVDPVSGALTTPLGGTSGNVYPGPQMWVDPNNNNIVWVMTFAGAVWVTYNGGQNFHLVRKLMNLAMPSCFATADTTTGLTTIAVDSNPMASAPFQQFRCVFDADHPFAIGGSVFDTYGGGSALVVGCSPIQRNDGVSPANYGEPGVISGDEIFIGNGGFVIGDPSFGTVTNPGIALGDSNCTGVASKRVYFGWYDGGTGIYKTNTAGGDLTSGNFSVVGSGGPSQSGYNASISNDWALGGSGADNNNLWVPDRDSSKFWRWVETPPSGSSLASNTWSTVLISSVFIGGDWAVTVATDPLTKGRATFFGGRGGNNTSLTYGDAPYGGTSTVGTKQGDTPWLHTDDQFPGDAQYDKVTNNKLWIADGVGLWYTNPSNVGGNPDWFSKMQPGLQSLIIIDITKCPSPSNKVIITAQDRNILFCPSPTQQPAGYYTQPGVAPNSGFTAVALDDPSVMYVTYALWQANGIFSNGQTGGSYWSVLRSSDGLTATNATYFTYLNTGGVSALNPSNFDPGAGYTTPGTYNGVALTGGHGSGATANIVVAGGVVTSVTLVNPGDFYAVEDFLSAAASSLGGRSGGRDFLIGLTSIGTIKTTNSSSSVTMSAPSHGLSNGATIGFSPLVSMTPGNNIDVRGSIFTVTVPDSNHLTFTAATTANASGFVSPITTFGNNGYCGSLFGNMAAPTSRDLFVVTGASGSSNPANSYISYGTTADDVNWTWNNTLYGGNPIEGNAGNAFSFVKPVTIERTTGKIAYFEADYGRIYGIIASLSSLSGGSGYTTPGTYNNVALTGGAPGTLATANITVSGGAVTAVTLVSGGVTYYVGGSLSAADSALGGRSGGAAFTISVATIISQPNKNSFFVSTDKGHTLTCPGGIGNLQNTMTGQFRGGGGIQVSATPGFNTHWWLGNGYPTDGTVGATNCYLRRTRDDGINWDNFSTNTQNVEFVAAGVPRPGNSYPSIYIVGVANGDTYGGVYRCDNMTGIASDTTTCIWQKLDNLKKADCSSITYITADPEIYGKFYLVTGDNGYVIGYLT